MIKLVYSLKRGKRREHIMKSVFTKLSALVCVLILFLLLLPSAAGAETMYNMVVNDSFLEYAADNTPIVVGGTVYIPYKVLIAEHNGGQQLGIFYGTIEDINTLSLYSKQQILTFYIDSGTTYDATGNSYPFRAIVRNGTTYVPAVSVCNYFGLQYSYLPHDQGVLIRIKQEGSYVLSDRMYVASADLKFKEQKKIFDRIQADLAAAAPSPSPSPSSSPGVSSTSRVQISFAFRCDGGSGPEALLDLLSGQDINALFLFYPGDLLQWDDQIRRLVAEGHRIGLITEGESVDDHQLQADEGNHLLSHIAHTKTDFLFADAPSQITEELSSLGWACWKSNITGIPSDGIRPASLAANIMLNVEAKRSYARILMDDSDTSVSALARLIPQLISGGHTFHTITELDLT